MKFKKLGDQNANAIINANSALGKPNSITIQTLKQQQTKTFKGTDMTSK